MIYRGPGFLAVVWFGFSPTSCPPPPHPSASSTGDSLEDWDCEKERQLADGRVGGRGLGEETNRTTARKHGPLYCKLFNTLCLKPSQEIFQPSIMFRLLWFLGTGHSVISYCLIYAGRYPCPWVDIPGHCHLYPGSAGWECRDPQVSSTQNILLVQLLAAYK